MKASELRIGNLLRNNLNGNILIPCDILCDGINTDRHEGLNYCFIEPIPLTEEWLLKFGFEFRNNNNHYGWYLLVSKNRVLTWCHSKEISLEFDNEDYDYNNTLFDFNCEYVHQLQNIYFALTNEELTLKQN